jgi:hypothetical protein
LNTDYCKRKLGHGKKEKIIIIIIIFRINNTWDTKSTKPRAAFWALVHSGRIDRERKDCLNTCEKN